MVVKLSLTALNGLPSNIALPDYDRDALTPGIVHFGVGNFHRSHQAMYLDRLMNQGKALDWALIGAGVFVGERKGRAVLEAQDWLTTLVEQEAESTSARVLGSMIDFIEPGDAEATVARMAQADIRIVSLTITEGGYFLDADQNFDAAHPEIRADAAAPDAPVTVFGMMLKALRLRRDAGIAPFTVMCCDNIPENGVVTRNALVGLARLSDTSFADWVESNVAFPNSMVDRITPATTDKERTFLADEFGLEDGWPVFSEEFAQWVVEDNFPNGRPPFEDVGVQFSDHVEAYETMKLRILNGGHSIISYPAALMDIAHVHEAMANPHVRGFLRKVTQDEIVPQVPPVPGTDPSDYFDLIERRFSNPKVKDQIPRLCFDGSNKLPKFILPVVQERLDAGQSVEGFALLTALWCRYCAGASDGGEIFATNDPNWDALQNTAKEAGSRPLAWLEQEMIFGDLAQNASFADAFVRWFNALADRGTEAVLASYIKLE